MAQTVPARVPAPAAGTALGCALVALAAQLGWAEPTWTEPGFLHAPYLAVAPLPVAALALLVVRPSERTCLWTGLAGLVVALAAKGSVWSAGRVAAALGGAAILLGSAVGYVYGPRFDLRRVPLVRPSPPTDGWAAALGTLAVASVFAVTTLPATDGLADLFAGLVLTGAVLAGGVLLALYRWGPDLRVAALGYPLVVPSLVLGAPLARLADPLAGFLVAAGAVGFTCLIGAGLVVVSDVSVARSLVGPPVRFRGEEGRSLSHLGTLPVVAVGSGLLCVVIGGLLPWHARVFRFGAPSPIPGAGVGVPGYYLVLGTATAAFLVAAVRWTVPAMRLVAGLGVLVAVLATGENPLDGGRLAAAVGAACVIAGALLADSDGRDVGLDALVPRRPRAPLAGWFAYLGWLLAFVSLAVSRPLFGSVTALSVDPFVRRGATGVFVVVVSAVDVTAVGSAGLVAGAAFAGAVVCLYRWHRDTGLALGSAGLVVVGWCLLVVLTSGALTAPGLLVVRLVGIGGLALVTAGALSAIGEAEKPESERAGCD